MKRSPDRQLAGYVSALANMDVAQEVINAAEDRASALAASDGERLRELVHEQFRWTTHVGQTFDRTEYIR